MTSPLDDGTRDREQRLARLRSLVTLLERNGSDAGDLWALIARAQQRHDDTAVAASESGRQAAIVLAQLGAFVAAVGTVRFPPRDPRWLTLCDDLREASRLCLAEARTAEDMGARRALAAHALELAMLGEQSVRPYRPASPPP